MKLILLTVIALITAMTGASTYATVLTFDDSSALAPVSGIATNAFTWDRFYTMDGTADYLQNSGFEYGMVSANMVAFNIGGNAASSLSKGGADFLFNGAYFTGAWNDGLHIDVLGTRDGLAVYQTTLIVDATMAHWFEFDWQIDTLRFTSYGGTHHSGFNGGSGTQFVMDNFTYNEPSITAVPEPAPLALLGVGLVGFAIVRRTTK